MTKQVNLLLQYQLLDLINTFRSWSEIFTTSLRNKDIICNL